jgi:hypothetical protein
MLRRLAGALSTASRLQMALGLTGAFLLSRAAYYAIGVRFNDYPLGVYWQFLPVRLLRTRLLESLFYLHSQPPLFNLYLGGALKLGGAQPGALFHAVNVLLGLGVLFASFSVMRRLGVGRPLAAVLGLAFVTSPAFVAYENWLFYTLPMAFLLLFSAWSLDAYLQRRSRLSGLLFFTALLAIAGTRSLFHLAWLVAIVLGLLLVEPRLRRTTLQAATLPCVLLLALYAKNELVFGRFSASTWIGMNLARLTVSELPDAERAALVEAGRLSAASRVPPFSPPDGYPETWFEVPERFARVPALASLEKRNEAANFNHYGYLRLSEAYLADALRLMRERPELYRAAVFEAWAIYFRSASSLKFLGLHNRRTLATAFDTYDYLLFGRVPWAGFVRGPRGEADFAGARYLGLVVGLPLVFGFGVWASLAASSGLERRPRIVVAFLCFNVAWVALVGNLLELGENNRFRFETDALSVALFGLLLQRARTKLRQ